jgi:uncharacterized protein with PIN domain
MIPYELAMLIYKASPSFLKALDTMEGLADEFDSNPNYTKDFRKEIAELKKKIGICPICDGEIIQTNTYEEDRGEYFGQPVKQKISMYKCKDCGYIKE